MFKRWGSSSVDRGYRGNRKLSDLIYSFNLKLREIIGCLVLPFLPFLISDAINHGVFNEEYVSIFGVFFIFLYGLLSLARYLKNRRSTHNAFRPYSSKPYDKNNFLRAAVFLILIWACVYFPSKFNKMGDTASAYVSQVQVIKVIPRKNNADLLVISNGASTAQVRRKYYDYPVNTQLQACIIPGRLGMDYIVNLEPITQDFGHPCN
ncbi:hypothetical protein [Vibrio sp. WXL103]|uniref:hypothetical protein n=1 Tax=Vibrio sp. WXL103 TaxID=3450710 RepID=UPI003EC8C347